MKKKNRTVMNSAWELARYGAKRFGGTSGLYIRCALSIVWHDTKYPPVYRPGLGTQLWMGFVERKEIIRNGQAALPGMSL